MGWIIVGVVGFLFILFFIDIQLEFPIVGFLRRHTIGRRKYDSH